MKTQSLQKYGNLLGAIFLMVWMQSSVLWAFDQEELLPPDIWRIQANLQVTPTYEKAFGKTRKSEPLRNLLIANPDMRQRIVGEIKRQETRVNLEVFYGFSENWTLSAKIPFVQKTQTARLALNPDATGSNTILDNTAERIIENLKSKQVQGLGDVQLNAVYFFNYTISHLFRGGFGVRLPTGQAGTPFGSHALAIGERQVGLSGVLHYTYFPAWAKLRHEFRIALMHSLKGTRRSLDGQEVDYSTGNVFDMGYALGYEQNNWLIAGEFQRQIGPESTLGETPQDDAFFADTLHFNLGYGNLSTLENYPLALPYQVRMGYKMPLRGRNIPIAPSWHWTGIVYF